MPNSGHGPNIGHGYVKYVMIDSHGQGLPPLIFPAMISRASRGVSGALRRVEAVEAGGSRWWVGEDALLAPSPLTILAQFACILIGGGGAELSPLTNAIQQRFTHARPVAQPQTAIARGYARLARRLAGATA